MREIEREQELGIERAEDQLDHPLVAGADQLDADRPEPVAERTDTRPELREHARPVAGELRREAEARRRQFGPARELLLAWQPVARGGQLDGGEAPGIEAEELFRVGPGRVEPRLPR